MTMNSSINVNPLHLDDVRASRAHRGGDSPSIDNAVDIAAPLPGMVHRFALQKSDGSSPSPRLIRFLNEAGLMLSLTNRTEPSPMAK